MTWQRSLESSTNKTVFISKVLIHVKYLLRMDGCVSNTRISDKHLAIKDPMQSVGWAVRKHLRQLQEFRGVWLRRRRWLVTSKAIAFCLSASSKSCEVG